MNKLFIWVVAVVVALVGGFFVFGSHTSDVKQAPVVTDYKTAEYTIDGQKIKLGTSTLSYFGNELKTDLNGDGREDVAFIVTYSPGGSGTFYYAVAALNTEKGYMGSDGYLLGDRIAPQATTLSTNPKQVGVVVFNYADRAPNEPMVAKPSVGKSAYLKLDPQTMQWGVVEPNFEGESRFPTR
jgi:hypothetical protein